MSSVRVEYLATMRTGRAREGGQHTGRAGSRIRGAADLPRWEACPACLALWRLTWVRLAVLWVCHPPEYIVLCPGQAAVARHPDLSPDVRNPIGVG